MRKILYIATTLIVSAAFGMSRIWLGFTLVYILFSLNREDRSLLWEIPMAVLSCSIITDVFADYMAECIKIIIPVSAVLTAYYFPKKLLLLFPVAIVSLLLSNIYAVAAMWATLWCSGREFIIVRQNFLYYSNIKKRLLQGDTSENYVEFYKKCDILENSSSV